MHNGFTHVKSLETYCSKLQSNLVEWRPIEFD